VRVPSDAPHPWQSLAKWVAAVRYRRRWRWGGLSQTKIEQLNGYGFCWKFDGETLDDTEGLVNEVEFKKLCGLTKVASYRRKGLVVPFGCAVTPGSGVGPYYKPSQAKDLREALGITLKSVAGLISEKEFKQASGLSRIDKYRKEGLIKPVGFAITNAGLSPFYRPSQIKRLKNRLRITLDSTAGLLNEAQFSKASGLTKISTYRQKRLIRPVGFAITTAGLGPFYHPSQINQLKKRLGITLRSTKGLLSEDRFRKESGLTNIAKYRERGLIKPVGLAMSGPAVGRFYHSSQIKQLKKRLGITLKSTQGLVSEKKFKKLSGLSCLEKYRRRGTIKPVGFAMSGPRVCPFYHPKQIKEVRAALGITLASTKGLLSEKRFAKLVRYSRIEKCRKKGLVTPVGFAASNAGIRPYYHPRQVGQLKKSLGITLHSTSGLLSEGQCKKIPGLSLIRKYRKQGMIKPVGFAPTTGAGIGPYYQPKQIERLRKALGITLKSTKGLLTEGQFRKLSGITRIEKYRRKGLIHPVGFAMCNAGVRPHYHPRQIKKLQRLLRKKSP